MNDKIIGYLIDRDDFEKLQGINKALFGDGHSLHPDKQRDLANLMQLILWRIRDYQITDEDAKIL